VSKRAATVAGCTLLALLGSMLFVPVRWHFLIYAEREYTPTPGSPGLFTESIVEPVPTSPKITRYAPVWNLDDQETSTQERVEWPVVFWTQAALLLLGGRPLTYVVRRERRRRSLE
jgi:hypothetical protein